MSYLRYGSVLCYVDGESTDYIFPADDYIEDYGKITNESIVELIAKNLHTDYPEFKTYLIQHLADKLNVKLRPKPLTIEEAFEKTIEAHRKWETANAARDEDGNVLQHKD